MPLLAKDLIEDSMALAYPHVAEWATSPVALLRQLTMLDEKVIDMLTTSAPARVSVAATNLTISTASNLTGYALEAARAYTDFNYFDSDGVWIAEIRIVPERHFDNPTVHPAGIVRVSTFFPCDPLGNRWSSTDMRSFFQGNGDTIRYRTIADPVRLTALTQTLASPDEARQYLIHNLVLGILLQTGGVPQERLRSAADLITDLERQLQLMVHKRVSTQSSIGA